MPHGSLISTIPRAIFSIFAYSHFLYFTKIEWIQQQSKHGPTQTFTPSISSSLFQETNKTAASFCASIITKTLISADFNFKIQIHITSLLSITLYFEFEFKLTQIYFFSLQPHTAVCSMYHMSLSLSLSLYPNLSLPPSVYLSLPRLSLYSLSVSSCFRPTLSLPLTMSLFSNIYVIDH